MTIEVRKPTPEEIATAESWPTWHKEASTFDWNYDEPETCYILEGAATVAMDNGEKVHFEAGDWVVFLKGLACTWQIEKDLKKKYRFG